MERRWLKRSVSEGTWLRSDPLHYPNFLRVWPEVPAATHGGHRRSVTRTEDRSFCSVVEAGTKSVT